MDPIRNPYQPGAGRRPPELAGRHPDLAAFRVLLERCEAGNADRGRVLHGLRGVGKTVLLNEFLAMAEGRAWITAKAEASQGKPVLPRLTQALHRSLREVTGRVEVGRVRRMLRIFKAFTLKVDPSGVYTFGVDIDPDVGRADSGDLSLDLPELATELGRTAHELGIGVALFVDEMQDVPRAELEALNLAVHEVGQGPRPLPFVVVGAGLPSLPAILADANTYAERMFEYRSIGPLTEDEATDALVRPAAQLGVAWSDAAVEEVLAVSAGYPYSIQLCGKWVWDYAVTSPISSDDAGVGIGYARRELDEGLYLSRWNRATPAQRQIMRVMAEFDEGADVPTAEIAKRLGRRRTDLSVPRDQLIKKGLVYARDRGVIAFTVPGMAQFVARQPD